MSGTENMYSDSAIEINDLKRRLGDAHESANTLRLTIVNLERVNKARLLALKAAIPFLYYVNGRNPGMVTETTWRLIGDAEVR